MVDGINLDSLLYTVLWLDFSLSLFVHIIYKTIYNIYKREKEDRFLPPTYMCTIITNTTTIQITYLRLLRWQLQSRSPS